MRYVPGGGGCRAGSAIKQTETGLIGPMHRHQLETQVKLCIGNDKGYEKLLFTNTSRETHSDTTFAKLECI